MQPLAEGALYWPARRALLVADLHLEKASWFARGGQMLPPYDSLATLDDLAAVIARVSAREVWCLGDSFHDDDGAARMPDTARRRLAALAGTLDWTWISGNHDPRVGVGTGGRVLAAADVDGLILRHKADPSDVRPELSGHFHPKISVRGRGHSVSRRCFVVSQRKIILPAFGALAGGLDAAHPAILAATGKPASAFVATRERLLKFAIAA